MGMDEFPIIQYAMKHLPMSTDFEVYSLWDVIRNRWPQVNKTTKAETMWLPRVYKSAGQTYLEASPLNLTVIGMQIQVPAALRLDDRAPIWAAYDPVNDTVLFAPYPAQMTEGSLYHVSRMQENGTWHEFVNEPPDA